MLTLYHQSGMVGGKWIPNSVPEQFRNRLSYKSNLFKSVKPKFITEIADYLQIPYKQVSPETYKGEHAYYHIEINWIDQAFVYRNVFEHIDDTALNLLKDKNSKLKLLLWFPNEGFSLSMPRFMEIIDFCINDLDLPREKIFLVFGDLNIVQNYSYWSKKKGYGFLNLYGMDAFEGIYAFEIDHMDEKLLSVEEFKKGFKQKNKNKRFIFKNANPRHHRLYFAAELFRKGLLNQSYYSWLNRYFTPNANNNYYVLRHYADEDQIRDLDISLNQFMKNAPYILDYNGTEIEHGFNQRVLINNHYTQSYFSFVTETTYEDATNENVLFITEKLYQPIVNFHPFIVASQVKTLKHLHQSGYETFPELFDESYDLEWDVKKRSKMILANIESFCKGEKDDIYFSNEVRDKLIHNRNLFFERKGKDKWLDVFRWLESFYDL